MPDFTRSNNSVLFINNNPITGVISYDIDGQVTTFPIRGLGDHTASGYIKSNLTDHKFKLDCFFSPYSPDFYIGGRSSQNNFFSSGKHDFIIRDQFEQKLISGAYLTNFSITAGVGELTTISYSFEADTLDINNNQVTDISYDATSGSFLPFLPQDVKVSGLLLNPSLLYTNECIQSISVETSLPRTVIKRIGSRIPFTRAIKEQPTTSVSVTLFKKGIQQGLTNNYLDQTAHNTGELNIIFGTGSEQLTLNIKELQLNSMSENLNLDGSIDTITYNYNGFFNKNSLTLQ